MVNFKALTLSVRAPLQLRFTIFLAKFFKHKPYCFVRQLFLTNFFKRYRSFEIVRSDYSVVI